MPSKSADKIEKLSREVSSLKRRVGQLEKKQQTKPRRSFWRSFSIVVLASVAGAMLVSANLVFWTGRTLIDTERYTEATRSVIKQPAVQDALALKATEAIFEKINIEQLLTEALPPRADFAVPTLAANIQDTTQKQVKNIVSSPKFEDVWVRVQTRSHERLVKELKEYNGDGTINIADVYTKIVNRLQGTKLEFLQNVSLPEKVGSIQVVETPYLKNASWVVKNFETIRFVTILLFLLLTILVVYISRDRHETARKLGVFYALLMLATLVAVRIGREIAVSQAEPRFQEAALQTWQALLQPFVLQTATILVLGLAVALVAWVSGSGKRAKRLQQISTDLLSGKVHTALFKKENQFTKWVGKYKNQLQWLSVVLGSVALLMIFITIANVLWVLALVAVVSIVINVVSARQ